jgi:hypothetical protein
MGNAADKEMLRKQIYERMNFKETDELLQIWYEANHEEWTDLAIDVVGDILVERLGEIPVKGARLSGDVPDQSVVQPYPNPDKLTKLPSAMRIFSWVILGIYVLDFLLDIFSTIQSGWAHFGSSFLSNWEWLDVISMLYVLERLGIGILYFLLAQAVSHGLLLLVEIKENGSEILKAVKKT